jgi:preprotein translocase subunit SecA
MAGLPVHLLTVNDYLTERDAREMGPIYTALGLSLGYIAHATTVDERRAIYARDIVYGTSKEIVFDYLRDRIVLGGRGHALRHPVEAVFGQAGCSPRLLTRGLHFGIVDEADSVLIDEARTPLIISGQGNERHARRFLQQALDLAPELDEGGDYRLDRADRRITLTAALSEGFGPLWSGRVRREEVVSQALSALYLFQRDEHYLVSAGKVEIIDALTGRVTEGRAWERGLHQLIELKEGLEISDQRDTLARISYQSFFGRYLHLSGMTGTAREVRRELWQVYGLAFVRVPYHKPCIRENWESQVFAQASQKWEAIAERARKLTEQGRAVLVGTSSVAASELAAEVLDRAGLEFGVLNAKQDQQEAQLVALAGGSRRITVATSMAGRGTDIKLEDTVRGSGGLHVILSDPYDSARVDRQLAGRCARQGDPGSFEPVLSLEDAEFSNGLLKLMGRLALTLGPERAPGRLLALAAMRMEQRQREQRSHLERQATRKFVAHQDDLLSISGVSE